MHYRIQEKDLWGEIMNIRIRTVDDLNSYHYTTISRSDVKESEYENRPYEETSWSFNQTISLNRHSPDPILSGIEAWLHGYLPFRGKYQEEAIFTLSIGKGGFVVLFEKRAIRYYLNGKAYNKATIYMALSRIIYKSCFDDKPAILFVALNKYLNIPDNVSHALENRAAYFWHSKMRPVNVSLNVQMISDTKCALEISDGIWGEISIKDMDTFVNCYRHGKNRGSWAKLTPSKLWERLLGERPSNSQLQVMVAFLQQNRTQDIVEKRAEELLNDLVSQYPDRIKMRQIGSERWLYIRGKLADWALQERHQKTGIQDVSTYVFGPRDSGAKFQNGYFNGPICIDNMAHGSPVGDQFATRAIALMNDVITIKRVNTIKNYVSDLEPGQTKYRFDWVEL